MSDKLANRNTGEDRRQRGHLLDRVALIGLCDRKCWTLADLSKHTYSKRPTGAHYRGVTLTTINRAVAGNPVELKTIQAIANALDVAPAMILQRNESKPNGVMQCCFDPGLDSGQELLNSLRELHTPTTSMTYFHRSLPYQLLPQFAIEKYNSSMAGAVKSYFDYVGKGRQSDYDLLKGQSGLECIMPWSDLWPLVHRQGPFEAFTTAEILGVVDHVADCVNERGLKFMLVDEHSISEASSHSEQFRRHLSLKSIAVLGDRFLLRREASDCLIVDDNQFHMNAFRHTHNQLRNMVKYDPESKPHMLSIFDTLRRRIESSQSN